MRWFQAGAPIKKNANIVASEFRFNQNTPNNTVDKTHGYIVLKCWEN